MSRFYEFLVLKCEYKYLVSHSQVTQNSCVLLLLPRQVCCSLCIALPSI